jgi:hypothetical protein
VLRQIFDLLPDPKLGVGNADPVEIVARLRRIADELEAGASRDAEFLHTVGYTLGTDVDGTPNVNLDNGQRLFALTYRVAR